MFEMSLTKVGILCLTFSVLCTQCHAYVNLALNKPTWQANQYKVGNQLFHSSNAVDGLKSNLEGRGGQCALSVGQNGPSTFWVNLASVFSIHDIRIYLRNDNNKLDTPDQFMKRNLGFYVYVSNTTNHLDGYLCFHDTKYTKSTIPTIVDISCPIHGQYVIYYNERLPGVKYPEDYSSTAFTDLCKMEVYGCKTGYYGFNCSLSCPYNCRHCHIESGVCLHNIYGYQGPQRVLNCSNEYLVPNSFLPCPDNCCCCQREKGECHLCENENEGPQCELDNAHDEPDWQFRFYVVVGTFLGSVTLNTFLLALLCLKRNRRKKMNVHKMITEVPNPLLNEANVIYDNPDGYVVGDYQELEALRVSSLYDSLQQQRDEGPDLRNEK